jgi:cyclopropane fatty-acyl-phospholipid synthase-like methyltransferase
MWGRIVRQCLDKAHPILPPGSRVLEVGYGDGLLSCHLAADFGWSLVGLECAPAAFEAARANVQRFGLEERIDLRLVRPEETWTFPGCFDGVFIKTVLYNATSLKEYAQWLDWVVSVLKPGGVFINFENGKANRLTYWYRKLRRRYYADRCMYDGRIQALYAERFPQIEFRHYGAVSQFVAPIPLIYEAVAALENLWVVRNADNSYIVAVIARSAP